MKAIDFEEVQYFETWWVWILVAALNTLFIFAIIKQIFLGIPFGDKPAPDFVLVAVELFFLLLLLFIKSIRLETHITDNGISFRFFPFQITKRKIEWHELKDAYMREYNSLYEYGGWGIRLGTGNIGNAYNTSASSNKGLQLQFNNGKRLLLGTQKPEELKLVIDTIIDSGKINRKV